MVCLDIPEQYRGVVFNPKFLPADLGDSYVKYMSDLYDNVCNMHIRTMNIALCAPPVHGKTTLAYACIQQLFKKGYKVFPLFDILEIKRIMSDIDFNRRSVYELDNPMNLYLSEILFVKIPQMLTTDVYDSIALLLDRRVRRSNGTIFLFNDTWENLVRQDYKNTLKNLLGDGSFCTIQNKTWRSK